MNISSVVVKSAPEYVEQVAALLNQSGQCEVYAHDEQGRIIVIIEGETTEEESQKLQTIQTLPHVLSAEMVYAFSESEFAPEGDKFEKINTSLIDQLNDERIDAKEIVYNGHVKDRL